MVTGSAAFPLSSWTRRPNASCSPPFGSDSGRAGLSGIEFPRQTEKPATGATKKQGSEFINENIVREKMALPHRVEHTVFSVTNIYRLHKRQLAAPIKTN